MIRFYSCLLCLMLFGCSDVNPGSPPIETEHLAQTVVELQIAESIINGEVPILVRDSMRVVYHDKVLEDFGYTRQEFDSLMWIVRQEPSWIDSLYSRAGDILAGRMAEEGEGGE